LEYSITQNSQYQENKERKVKNSSSFLELFFPRVCLLQAVCSISSWYFRRQFALSLVVEYIVLSRVLADFSTGRAGWNESMEPAIRVSSIVMLLQYVHRTCNLAGSIFIEYENSFVIFAVGKNLPAAEFASNLMNWRRGFGAIDFCHGEN
jgi:hypothetical protein